MDIKNPAYKPRLIHRKGKKPLIIGPRAKVQIDEKDLASSSQLRGMLKKGRLRILESQSGMKIKKENTQPDSAKDSGKDV